MAQAVTLAMAGGSGSRSTLKTVQMLDFEKGSDSALEDLDRWLTDFGRVADHVSGGRGLPAKDKIVHLRACWPATLPGEPGQAGENLRMAQETAEYKRMEAGGDCEGC